MATTGNDRLSSLRVELPAEGLQALASTMIDAVRRVFFDAETETRMSSQTIPFPTDPAWLQHFSEAEAEAWAFAGFTPEEARVWGRFGGPLVVAQMRVVLANAFSLSMIEPPATVRVEEVTAGEAAILLQRGFESAIGHAATAQVLSTLLGVEVPVNRVAVTLQPGDILLVFQLQGRLEEGRVLSAEEVRALPHRFLLVRLV